MRFLPDYDNVLLGHADRSRIVAKVERALKLSANNMSPGSFLVDGQVRGLWKIERARDRAAMIVEPLSPLSEDERTEVADEGLRLLAFAAAGGKAITLHIIEAG